MSLPTIKFPVPKTTLGRAASRAILVAIVAGISYFMQDASVAQGGLIYFLLSTVKDLINSNIANV